MLLHIVDVTPTDIGDEYEFWTEVFGFEELTKVMCEEKQRKFVTDEFVDVHRGKTLGRVERKTAVVGLDIEILEYRRVAKYISSLQCYRCFADVTCYK